ncbi:MAG: hypothetical protein JW709_10635, partial [Sedimentisphaerales bacterium]|nr:hypothetical protein [Sedimentisphaerales bacterium]
MINYRHRQYFEMLGVIGVIIGLCLCQGSMAAQINITLPNSPVPVQQACSVTLDAGNPFTPFVCEDVYFLNKVGEPQIPWAMVTILLAPEADLETLAVSVNNANYTPAEGQWFLVPTPPSYTWREDGTKITIWPEGVNRQSGEDTGIYQTNAFWPAESARLADAGMIRTYKVAQVAVPLGRYNPVSGAIQLLDNIDINLDYTNPAPAGSARSAASVISDPIGREWVSSMAANFTSMSSLYETPAVAAAAAGDGDPTPAVTTEGYVIITTDYIAQNSAGLQEFVAHKQLFYYDVQVITEIDFGGGTGDTAADNIRAWLKAHYLADNIKYVLLIGDPRPLTGQVPMKAAYAMYNAWLVNPDYPEYTPTDHYYAELTGDWDKDNDGRMGEGDDDFGSLYANALNEVVVGRIPYYGSLIDLNSILRKTVTYERQFGSATNWRKNCLLPMKPLNEEDPSWPLGEAIKDSFLVPNSWDYYRIYDTPAAYPPPGYEATPCTETNVLNAWKAAPYYGAVIWQTHGGSTGASYIFSSGSAPQLNDDYPSFTFQASCLTAHPETTNNLAYALLQNGGIGTIGATRVSFGGDWTHGYDNYTFIGSMAYDYAERLIGQGMSGGDALAGLRRNLNSSVIIMSDWHNLITFNLYGDPSVTIESQVIIPTITPPSGVFYPDVTAEVYFPAPDWPIHYTTDGSDPD